MTNNELSRDIVCIFEVIYVITILVFHFAAADKVSLNKRNIIYHINVVTKPHRILTSYFLSRNIS